MGVSSWLGLGKETERILKRYGVRSGSVINATGTGTEVVLTLNNYNKDTSGVSDILDKNGELYITAFSSNGTPIRPHSVAMTETMRSLTGRLHSYRKYPSIDIDLTVIGNSLDYYKLAILSSLYLKRGLKTLIPPDTSKNEVIDQMELGTYKYQYKDRMDVPLLNMRIISNSAPGANAILEGGVITDGDVLMGIEGNSKISDRTFSFAFSSISEIPSWGKQHYDPTTRPNIVEELTGIEIL